MSFIAELLVFAFAFFVASKLLPNIKMTSAWSTLPAAFIYIISYELLSWVLNTLLTIASLGLLSFLNFFLVPVAAILAFGLTSKVVDSYKVEDTGSIVWGTLIVTLVHGIVTFLW